MFEWHPEWTKSAFYTVVAAIGGALGYLYRESNMGRKVVLFKLLLSSAVAAFLGYHIIFILREWDISDNLIGAINGVTAFAGVEITLRIFDKVVLRRLGISYEQSIAQELIRNGWTPPPGIANLDGIQPVSVFANPESGIKPYGRRSTDRVSDVESVEVRHGEGNVTTPK